MRDLIRFKVDSKPSQGYLTNISAYKNEIIQQIIMVASCKHDMKNFHTVIHEIHNLMGQYKACVLCEVRQYIADNWENGVVSLYSSYDEYEDFEDNAKSNWNTAYKALDPIVMLAATDKPNLLKDENEEVLENIPFIIRKAITDFDEYANDALLYEWKQEHKEDIIPEKELTLEDLNSPEGND